MISVIIPCFNAFLTLREAIGSLPAGSSRPGGQELEIILADDGSSDGTIELIRELAASDPRVVPIFNPENRGVSFTRNAALKQARGEFIFFMDADDKLMPNALETLVARMSPDVDFVRGKHLLWDVASGECKPNIGEEYNSAEVIAVPPQAFPQITTIYSSWNALMRRSVIAKAGLSFDEDLSIGEDRLFNFRYFAACRKITMVSDYTYLWRRNDAGGRQATQVLVKKAAPMFRSIYKAVQLLQTEWFGANPYHRSYLATGMLVEFCNNLAAFSAQIEGRKVAKEISQQIDEILGLLQPDWIKTEKYGIKGYIDIYDPLYRHISSHVGQKPDDAVLREFFVLLGRIRRDLIATKKNGPATGAGVGDVAVLMQIFAEARKNRGEEALALERRILERSGLMDVGYYKAIYPDVAASGIDLMTHFLDFGAAEMRDPNDWFNTRDYFMQNPHLIVAGINPLTHYVVTAG